MCGWEGRYSFPINSNKQNSFLFRITDNEPARRRNITEVICISKEPKVDLQREGFRNAPDIDATIFTLGSNNETDMLSVFSEVCDSIDETLREGQGVLVCDVGGGVAALAAYIMKKHKLCMPEAMTAITRARLKRAKPTFLPSQRIIDMLHNDFYQSQLEMWQACDYDIYENVILNPGEPREKWVVQRVAGSSAIEKKRDDVVPPPTRPDEWFPQILEEPHRLSTIEEVEDEARRLSTIHEE